MSRGNMRKPPATSRSSSAMGAPGTARWVESAVCPECRKVHNVQPPGRFAGDREFLRGKRYWVMKCPTCLAINALPGQQRLFPENC